MQISVFDKNFVRGRIFVFCAILLALISSSLGIYVQNELNNNTKRNTPLSPAEWTEPYEDGLWSSFLEEWTLNNK